MMVGIRRFPHHFLPLINTQVSPALLIYHFLAIFCLKKKGCLQPTDCHNLVVSNNKVQCRCWSKNWKHHIITKPSHRYLEFEWARHSFCKLKLKMLWRTRNLIRVEVEANANMLTDYWEHPHACTRISPKIWHPIIRIVLTKLMQVSSQIWSWCGRRTL